MVLVAPAQVTRAPARVPAPYGLFSAVPPASQAPDGARWQSGLAWTDAACEDGTVIIPDCSAPTGLPLSFTAGQAAGEALAFTLAGEFLCSPVGWTPAAAQDAALAQLLAHEEELAARQMVAYLTTSSPLQGSSVAHGASVRADLAKLESLLSASYGSRGMVLASLATAYELMTDLDVMRQGSSLFTIGGTPLAVVRTDVTGFTLGIVPQPLIIRGDPFPGAEPAAAGFHRQANDLYAVALREYAMGWTKGCGASYIALAP